MNVQIIPALFYRILGAFFGFILGALSHASSVSIAQPISVIDDLGRAVSITAPAKRVIALAPHIVENIFVIGAGPRIVGVVSHSDFPDEAKNLPIVGGYQGISLEQIVALKPDLVVAWPSGNGRQWIESIERLGIPVYADEPHTLKGVSRSLSNLGQLTGKTKEANQAIAQFESKISLLKKEYSNKSAVSVFYQIWHKPLQTLNGKHVVSDVLRLCGGQNIFNDAKALAPQVSIESVVMAKPKVIFHGSNALQGEDVALWQSWPNIPAVKHNAIFALNSDWMHRHTTRLALGAESVCQALDKVRRL